MSLDVEAIKRQFADSSSLFERLREEVSFILSQGLQAKRIRIHSLSSRIKGVDSFIEKAVRRDFDDPFGQVEDIIGIRVVLLFLSDIQAVEDLIEGGFEVISKDNKIESFEASSFEYMSLHYIVELRKTYRGPRYDPLRGLRAEIQVRTILMDAWANVSHYLDYKAESSIPTELRRDFYALSGLFYVADKHFELFFGESQLSQRQAAESINTDDPNLDQETNFDTLKAYLEKKFVKREHASAESISTLVTELVENGYETLSDVDREIDRAAKAFAQYEKDHPPTVHKRKGKFADTGVVRISLIIADANYKPLQKGSRSLERDYAHLVEDIDEVPGSP